jgi:hypothetical protein
MRESVIPNGFGFGALRDLQDVRKWSRRQADYLRRTARTDSIRLYTTYLLQLRISENLNLNFWGHPTQEMPTCETGIHDHMYDFESDILYGTLKNLKYAPVPNPESGAMKQFWVRRRKDEQGHWVFSVGGEGHRFDPGEGFEENFPAGVRYGLKAEEYHSNEMSEPVVTLMHSDLATSGNNEYFLVPFEDKDYTTTMTMRNPTTPEQFDEAWDRIEGFLQLMGV